MIPLPWSISALDSFTNCPKAYQERWVLKNFKEAKGAQQNWGDNVHKTFELRQSVGQALPIDLEDHEPYMLKLDTKPGILWTELKINLDRKAQPINDAFARDIWFRGGIDWLKYDSTTFTCTVVDYKTGKKHEKWKQLAMYAIWCFAMFPHAQIVDARFYWTTDMTEGRKVWGRADLPMLWDMFLGDLRQYVEAFKAEVWQPRPSGLCKPNRAGTFAGCPVITCPHNGSYKKP